MFYTVSIGGSLAVLTEGSSCECVQGHCNGGIERLSLVGKDIESDIVGVGWDDAER